MNLPDKNPFSEKQTFFEILAQKTKEKESEERFILDINVSVARSSLDLPWPDFDTSRIDMNHQSKSAPFPFHFTDLQYSRLTSSSPYFFCRLNIQVSKWIDKSDVVNDVYYMILNRDASPKEISQTRVFVSWMDPLFPQRGFQSQRQELIYDFQGSNYQKPRIPDGWSYVSYLISNKDAYVYLETVLAQ